MPNPMLLNLAQTKGVTLEFIEDKWEDAKKVTAEDFGVPIFDFRQKEFDYAKDILMSMINENKVEKEVKSRRFEEFLKFTKRSKEFINESVNIYLKEFASTDGYKDGYTGRPIDKNYPAETSVQKQEYMLAYQKGKEDREKGTQTFVGAFAESESLKEEPQSFNTSVNDTYEDFKNWYMAQGIKQTELDPEVLAQLKQRESKIEYTNPDEYKKGFNDAEEEKDIDLEGKSDSYKSGYKKGKEIFGLKESVKVKFEGPEGLGYTKEYPSKEEAEKAISDYEKKYKGYGVIAKIVESKLKESKIDLIINTYQEYMEEGDSSQIAIQKTADDLGYDIDEIERIISKFDEDAQMSGSLGNISDSPTGIKKDKDLEIEEALNKIPFIGQGVDYKWKDGIAYGKVRYIGGKQTNGFYPIEVTNPDVIDNVIITEKDIVKIYESVLKEDEKITKEYTKERIEREGHKNPSERDIVNIHFDINRSIEKNDGKSIKDIIKNYFEESVLKEEFKAGDKIILNLNGQKKNGKLLYPDEKPKFWLVDVEGLGQGAYHEINMEVKQNEAIDGNVMATSDVPYYSKETKEVIESILKEEIPEDKTDEAVDGNVMAVSDVPYIDKEDKEVGTEKLEDEEKIEEAIDKEKIKKEYEDSKESLTVTVIKLAKKYNTSFDKIMDILNEDTTPPFRSIDTEDDNPRVTSDEEKNKEIQEKK